MRLTKTDWLNEGMNILAEHGIQAITIERLLQALNVTKGSFYHHFADIGDFKRALVETIEQEHTFDVITFLAHYPTPQERLHQLITIISNAPPQLEVQFRAWAFSDAEVRMAQERIDQQRIAYVATLCREIGLDQPQSIAQILYAMYVGGSNIQPALRSNELHIMYMLVEQGLGLGKVEG